MAESGRLKIQQGKLLPSISQCVNWKSGKIYCTLRMQYVPLLSLNNYASYIINNPFFSQRPSLANKTTNKIQNFYEKVEIRWKCIFRFFDGAYRHQIICSTGLETGCKPVLFELAPRLWSRFLFPESEKTKRKLHTLQHKDSNDRQVQRFELL